jgi:replicative superfamily II helicase
MGNVNPDSPENWGKRFDKSFTINGRPADAPRPPAPVTVVTEAPRPVTVASQSFSDFEQIRREYRDRIDAINRDGRLTDEGRVDARRKLAEHCSARTDANAAAIRALRQEVEADYATLQAKLRTIPMTPEAQAKASRDAQRHLHAIDSAQSPTAKLREIIDTAPEDELAVVLQEGPARLAAMGQPTGWIDQAVEARSPELKAARDKVDKAEKLAVVAEAHTSRLHKGFTNPEDAPRTPLIDASAIGLDPERD